MNAHLKPVFEILLPGLGKAGVSYWVYGGVSIAAYKGVFFRRNGDVDIFVKNNDFEKVRSTLRTLCNENNFKIIDPPQLKDDQRPRIDIKIGGKKKFSVIPVYLKNEDVLFRYPEGDQEYSGQLLNKRERNVSGFRFFTPPDEYIKELFKEHIKARPDKKSRSRFIEDAKAILTPEEFVELEWSIVE